MTTENTGGERGFFGGTRDGKGWVYTTEEDSRQNDSCFMQYLSLISAFCQYCNRKGDEFHIEMSVSTLKDKDLGHAGFRFRH